MSGRRRPQAFQRLWEQVTEGSVGDLVQRFRPVSRTDFLSDLHQRGAAAALDNGRGLKAAWNHLGAGWTETVDAVAAPATLPAVVERRTRHRVSPFAPWATSSAAGLGAVVVVAGDNQVWIEALGVAGIIALVGSGAAVAWRPRVRRSDRRYRVTGTAALNARADVLAADVARSTADPRALGTGDRLLIEIQGAARSLDALEEEGRRVGLLHSTGRAEREPLNPAEQELAGELLLLRAELLHDVMSLQLLAQQHSSRFRSEDRATYREVNDHLGGGDGGHVS